MNTATKVCKPRQVKRTVRLKLAPSEFGPGIINITAGKVDQDYFFLSFPSDFGRAFLLEKTGGIEDDQYHVNLDLIEGKHRCDCLGHSRWQKCKHVDGLLALIKAGKL
jgi:hypothetical protein